MEKETPSMLERLDWDTASNIIGHLNHPADLVRFALASRSCRKLVVESRSVKDLCIKISPEVSRFDSVVDEDKINISEGPSSSKGSEWEYLKIEYRIYAVLAHELMGPPAERSCINEAIVASSTDNYPEETISNTLDARHIQADRPSYWSSKGESNIEVPETLTYALETTLCVVHEVKIRPFRAYFQVGTPIYSANAVRFRFGYSILLPGSNSSALGRIMSSGQSACEDYVWTYVSPEYPMQQEDKLQTFKFPRPVLSVGDIFQVEFLGRVQKQQMDGLYYICICHVHVVGRPLSIFNFEVLGKPGKFVLEYSENRGCLDVLSEDTSRVTSEDEVPGTWHSFAERLRQIRAGRVLAMLGNIGVTNFIAPNDQDSDDEDVDDYPVIF